MGLVISEKHIDTLQHIADRERSPMYTVGDVTGDQRFVFQSKSTGAKPMDFNLEDMFGSSPKTILEDQTIVRNYNAISYEPSLFQHYLEDVLKLESRVDYLWILEQICFWKWKLGNS